MFSYVWNVRHHLALSYICIYKFQLELVHHEIFTALKIIKKLIQSKVMNLENEKGKG